jgi:hypothetical protein
MKGTSLVIMLLLFVATAATATQKRKVLLIGIDGVRSDALQLANTPNLDSLIAHGAYTYDSWCAGITISGPAWSSIFSGVWYPKHGVTNNTYSGAQFDKYHLFPALAKQYKPTLVAAEVIEWPPLIDNVPNIYDGYNTRIQVVDGATTPTGTAAVAQLADPDIDILTVYYDKVDLTGHISGFSPTNAAYINAIQSVDANIGTVIAALKARPDYANEDWLILVITDHGGIGTSHGGSTTDERHIWFIANGTYITHRQLNVSGADPGSYAITPPGVNNTVLASVPVHTDVAVTALHFLLYDIPGIYPSIRTTDSLDGKSWLDTIYSPPASVGIAQPAASPDLEVKMYPNPVNDIVTFWFEHRTPAVAYKVVNTMGETVKQVHNLQMNGLKLNIDLSDLPNGSYTIHLEADSKNVNKQVVVRH